ncbi:MAG: hypothetical protein FWH17_05110 [Oscillospiraceae bacterium]|nr:hypothetical protein [Oscillospiraceae bacterium]
MKILNEHREPAGEMVSINEDGTKSSSPLGENISTEYECPCGKGKIVATFENMAGYRDSWVKIECEDCSKKYSVSYNWARDEKPVLTKY